MSGTAAPSLKSVYFTDERYDSDEAKLLSTYAEAWATDSHMTSHRAVQAKVCSWYKFSTLRGVCFGRDESH